MHRHVCHLSVVVAILSATVVGCLHEPASPLSRLETLVDRHAQLRSAELVGPVSIRGGTSHQVNTAPTHQPSGDTGSVRSDWLPDDTGLRGDVLLADFVLGEDGRAERLFGETPSTSSATVRHRREDRATPLPSFWSTVRRDLRAMPSDLWADTKKVYTSPQNLLILGVAYGGSLAVQSSGPDGTIEDSLDRKDIFSHDLNEGFGAVGNPLTHFGVAGLWYLVGQQRQDAKTYDVGKKLFSALMINGLSTMAGKFATWDKAPNGELFAFPSGHTSSSFTVASVMHEAYGPWAGGPLYALSTLVAIERLDDGEHYLSDVIMGGVMGLVIGHTVGGDRDIELFGGRIVPFADPSVGATGLAWHKEF